MQPAVLADITSVQNVWLYIGPEIILAAWQVG